MAGPGGTLLALWLVVLCASPAAGGPDCDRIVAVGDLHGAYESFVSILQKTEILDGSLGWRGEDTCLVQLGDVVDRGARSKDVLDLLIDLERQAPGKVFVLLGNHEVMNLLGDLRYTLPEEFATFAGQESAAEREAGYKAFLATSRALALPEEARRAEFDTAFPPGWFAHRRNFSPEGRYGRWLLEKKIAMKIGTTVFVHGGLGPYDARQGLQWLNETVDRDVREFFRLKGLLIDRGVFDPLTPFATSLGITQLWLEEHAQRDSELRDRSTAEAAMGFVGLTRSPIVRVDGPLWHRDLALADEQAFRPTLERILADSAAARIVVAHTTTPDHRIRARFNHRVFLIDTGAGPAYGGRASALEIHSGGWIRAVYLDGEELLVDPPLDDARIERILAEGDVIEDVEIGSGITRPRKLSLEWGPRNMSAAFKAVNIQETDLTRWRDAAPEFNFSDRYVYERAAYLLDRELGLDMVPVAVLRTIDGNEGALIEWIPDAINENDRREGNHGPEDPLVLIRQRALMRLFDALILNADRNLSNQLYTADWKLRLIDHSRGFRLQHRLPEGFLAAPISLPRRLVPRLEALDKGALERRMRGLLSKAQIRALLARRDAILEKIRKDRREYGDELVFHDPVASPGAVPRAAGR